MNVNLQNNRTSTVNKLNITLVPDYFFPMSLGAEIHVYNLARKLKQRNIPVSILTRNVPQLNKTKDNLHVSGFPSLFGQYHWYMKGYYLPLFDPFLALIPILKRSLFNKSIIHAHGPIGLSIAAHKKCSNFPLLLSVHDYWPICFQRSLLLSDESVCNLTTKCSTCLSMDIGQLSTISKLVSSANTVLIENFDKFIAVSHFVKTMLVKGGIPGKKIEVIHNWINLQKLEPYLKNIPANREKTVLYVGQVSKLKGTHLAVEAMTQLTKEIPDLKFRVIGSGPLLSTLRKKVKKNGLFHSICFLGTVNKETLFNEYRKAKLFVCPSLWPDPCPTVVLEAMAFKLPVIASNIGGIPEMVNHGFNGFLFPAGDTAALAESVSKLVTNDELCSRFGENSYLAVKSFDINSQLSKLLSLYSEFA
ncbi:MAG: glycosyltransferase family 4 protein [Candidatus Bathyarchaeota archaeon]|nr:glycosyltransferase family 4 protein [Candidatus Bathyarchaeum sp.]